MGSGALQRLVEEMTTELHDLRDVAREQACDQQRGRSVTVQLEALISAA